MHRPQRLATLLKSFRLHPEASAVQLKEAYHREAKRLHPDRQSSGKQDVAARDFADVQSRFEEATALLRKYGHMPSATPRPLGGHDSNSYHAYAPFEHASGIHTGSQALPVMGLPAKAVYTVSAAISFSVASAWILLQQKREPVSESKRIAVQPQAATSTSTQIAATSLSGSRLQLGREAGAASFRDASAYYSTLSSQFRRTKSRKQFKSGRLDPQLRDGVALTPAHVAAEDDHVWFLERCGASAGCRGMLEQSDRRGDTPLHRCANEGNISSCRTLLRLGANPSAENKWHLRPEDLAAHKGHSMTAALLQATRTKSACDPALKAMGIETGRHPDGLGLLSNLPEGIYYNGPYHSACLRNAVNYACGAVVVGDLDLSGEESSRAQEVATSSVDWKVNFALQRVRLTLKGSNFELERTAHAPDVMGPRSAAWCSRDDGAEVRGLLLFEAAGSVTPDAPGHWMAIRACSSSHPLGADGAVAFRLDPVRGVYRLSGPELAELLVRYPAWRVVQHRSNRFFSKPS